MLICSARRRGKTYWSSGEFGSGRRYEADCLRELESTLSFEGSLRMKTGVANLPLHGGRAPRWLFQRMKTLAREIVILITDELGPSDMLRKLADPFWFQSFGCILGFDWHSSGVTTTVCGAVKEGISGLESDLGFFATGGKGRVSRRTPLEIEGHCGRMSLDPERFVYSSRMAAKVDSAAVQDGYQLYHHAFFFVPEGEWAVIQQGMSAETRYARRYHWLGGKDHSFVCEPHLAVCCKTRGLAFNMVAAESEKSREATSLVARDHPDRLIREMKKIQTLTLPRHHDVKPQNIDSKRMQKILIKIYEGDTQDFESLLRIEGVGPKTIRALSLIGELVYGARPSFRDPARFSFAHGGKDGHPYPVDRENYDGSIKCLQEAIRKARIGEREKLDALKRLTRFMGE